MFENLGSTIFFWIAWGFISYFLIKKFYFEYKENLIQRLRILALIIDLAILIFIFFPWLPQSLGGQTGWQLFLSGQIDLIFYTILLILAIVLFLSQKSTLLKIAATFHIISSILIFAIMIRLLPGTYTLKLHDIAPIISALLLLIGNVIVLLMWHQLQLKSKEEQK